MFRFLISFWLFAATTVTGWSAERIIVLAPSSMTDVMANLGALFKAETGIDAVVSLAGSAQLARQLDAGVKADVFLTADKLWMDWAADRGLLDKKSIRVVAENRLVLAVRKEVENWADWKSLVTKERFAMADAEVVPAGRYAKQALQYENLWPKAKLQAVFGENVRVTLRRLALGEVASAIVYETDVSIEPRVRAFHTFADGTHDPIEYYAAFTPKAREGGMRFLGFLTTPIAQKSLVEFGFQIPQGAH